MKTLISLTILLTSSFAWAKVDYKMSGQARIRGDGLYNLTDFDGGNSDHARAIGSRFRFKLLLAPHKDFDIRFVPQFSASWGTSGGTTTDYQMGVQKANLAWRAFKWATLTLGRQTLAYGDQLLLGESDWSLSGRAHDAIHLRTHIGSYGHVDLFSSKIEENNSTALSLGDDGNLYGLYSQWNAPEAIKDYLGGVDLYALWNSTTHQTAAFGLRIEGQLGSFYDVVEGVAQSGGGLLGHTYLGYRGLPILTDIRLGLLAANSKNQTFYPTPTRFFGYSNVFSMNNILNPYVSLNWNPWGKLKLNTSAHFILRDDRTIGVNSVGIGTGSTDASQVATNLTLTAEYSVIDQITIFSGGAFVLPGAYIKNELGSDLGVYYWAGLNSHF